MKKTRLRWSGSGVSIADAGLTSAEARAAAWADVERIETQLETAAANLAEVLREEQEEAWQAAEDADAPEPDTIAAALEDATTAVTMSESVATTLKMRKPKLAQPLLNRAQAARVRIADLWDRLRALY